ncbi:MAG: VWA domain-containing protein [Flavobacteriales bacterium]|nr:VWA domain-containing protein [Flavobacteriales bacterium]
MKNKTTLYHFIVDQSGSMQGMEQQAIAGFNTQLEKIQDLEKTMPDQEFLCSLTFFNSEVQDVLKNEPVKQIELLSNNNYQPGGMTALLDAVGGSIDRIEKQFGKELENDEISVVMVIITDGYENASKYFTYHMVAQKIVNLDETGKWTFSYLGADFDAIHTSKMMNIRKENVMNFRKKSYASMMDDLSDSIGVYAEEKRKGNLKKDILDIFKEKDRRND